MNKHPLKLYVIGHTPIARRAMANLESLCARDDVRDRFAPQIINLLEYPELAEEQKIVATPLLVKERPEPVRRVVGDLSDAEEVAASLGL